jgi:hypothetical protein
MNNKILFIHMKTKKILQRMDVEGEGVEVNDGDAEDGKGLEGDDPKVGIAAPGISGRDRCIQVGEFTFLISTPFSGVSSWSSCG